MPNPAKFEAVDAIKESVANCHIAIATSFIGINAEQATELRKRLREQGVQLKVFKNTLTKRALEGLELSDATEFLEGPTAWAFSEDPVAPAKVLKEYSKEVPHVEMRGGILEGRLVDKGQLDALASLPPRDALLAQVVGTIAMPLRNFVSVVSAPTRNLVTVLDQIRKQKEEQAAA